MNNKKPQEYEKYLKEKIKEYCNLENCIEVYWDYNDMVSKETIQKHINDNIHYKEDVLLENKILDELYELNPDYEYQLEKEFIDYLIENSPTSEIKNYIQKQDYTEIIEDLYNCGYEGIDWNIEDLLANTEIKVNILLATSQEQNYDMGSIVTAFGNDCETPFVNWNIDCDNLNCLDNSLTYLIHQQGYTLKDIYKNLLYQSNAEPEFIKGICYDINNNSSEAMSELGIYIKLRGNEISDFCRELQKVNTYIVVDKDTNIGLFNEWSGSGGYPDSYLEKDFIFPTDMIRNIQIEGAGKECVGYTVNEVYGLTGEFWKDNSLKYTNVAPKVNKENLSETISEISKNLENEQEYEY